MMSLLTSLKRAWGASIMNLLEREFCGSSLFAMARKAAFETPLVPKLAMAPRVVSVTSLSLPSIWFSVFRDFLLEGWSADNDAIRQSGARLRRA